MRYKVVLTDHAAQDLADIDGFIGKSDTIERADYVLGKLEEALMSLSELPDRGVYPQELSTLGIREFREIFFKPYRIVYRVIGKSVYVYLIADGRRDMQALLRRRLLEM